MMTISDDVVSEENSTFRRAHFHSRKGRGMRANNESDVSLETSYHLDDDADDADDEDFTTRSVLCGRRRNFRVGMSECCMSGTLHKGSPAGTVATIGGLNTYVSPPKDGSKKKTLVFITDIFGYEFTNTRLLADAYARRGFYCYVPDVHSGDSLHPDLLTDIEPPLKDRDQLTLVQKGASTAKVTSTLYPWVGVHRESVTRPIIDGFFNAVKMIPDTNKIGAIGFCWGGRYAILQAQSDVIDAAYACHPSLVGIPADFENLKKPLSLACGTKDSLLAESDVDKIKEVFKGQSVPTEVELYPDQIHGFALRGDWSSDKDREAMDKAEKQGAAWFDKYLS
ncbi:hypothetical protein MRB53_037875 [Persea americana]|nr:hypothetical protein MRB53_037875 [Persea americana]